MDKTVLLLAFWVTALVPGKGSLGRLIKTPSNEAPMWFWYNHSLNCSSSLGSAAISWYFVPVDETASVTIATGSTIDAVYTTLYWIDQPTPNASNIIVFQPSNLTAGTYMCADNEMTARAEYVVIYEFPTSSELSTRYISNGDLVIMSCTVNYFGNRFISPIFYVYDIDDVDNPILTHNISSAFLSKEGTLTTATATFVQTAFCSKMKSFRCNIFFGKPKELLPGSAINAPNHVLQREFLQENVSCVPTPNNMTIIGAVSGSIVYSGAILVCHVTSNPPANYSWTDLTYGNSSSGPRLTVWHDGSYQCTASNYLNGQWNTALKIISDLTVENFESWVKPLHGPIAGGTEVQIIITASWKQTANISAVYFGNKLKATLHSNLRLRSSSHLKFVVTTPNAMNVSTGQPMPITVELKPGPFNLSLNQFFTYHEKPDKENVYICHFSDSDETLLIAVENNSSSLPNPAMQLTRTVIRKDFSFETLKQLRLDYKNDEYICMRYRTLTARVHLVYRFEPGLHQLGFLILVNLIVLVIVIHLCRWKRSDRQKCRLPVIMA